MFFEQFNDTNFVAAFLYLSAFKKTNFKSKLMIPNYPVIDGHRLQYVLHPVCRDGKWRAAEVVEGGYIDPFGNPVKIDFKTQLGCQLACGVHNKCAGWTPEEVEEIISLSMNLSKSKEVKTI